MMHPNGYAVTQRETLSGRALEREVFVRITARLEGARSDEVGERVGLLEALAENKRLWLTLAVDLANPENQCPKELRIGLLNLAAFVENHTAAVIDGRGTKDVLVEINRNIIDGMAAKDRKAA